MRSLPGLLIVFMLPYALPAQSRFGYTVGIDSAAMKFHLKSRTDYLIVGDSLQDTLERTKYHYTPEGYIAGQESRSGSVRFSYNDDGYLIAESFTIRGPVANGVVEDTVYRTESVTYQEFGSTSRIIDESWRYVSSGESFGDRHTYEYDSLGRISSLTYFRFGADTLTVTHNYVYDALNQLIRTETSDGSLVVEYFCDANGLLTERRSLANGKAFQRQIRVYEYY